MLITPLPHQQAEDSDHVQSLSMCLSTIELMFQGYSIAYMGCGVLLSEMVIENVN